MTDLGERIRSARMRMGMTQRELADAVGLHQSEISRIERGARDFSVGTFGRIAVAFGMRPEELMADRAA